MPRFTGMSDQQVLQEWQATPMVAASLDPGVEPPAYTPDLAARHAAAEAELVRRGYAEQAPGWWVDPHNCTPDSSG